MQSKKLTLILDTLVDYVCSYSSFDADISTFLKMLLSLIEMIEEHLWSFNILIFLFSPKLRWVNAIKDTSLLIDLLVVCTHLRDSLLELFKFPVCLYNNGLLYAALDSYES